jgi:hypothetical protein
MRGKGDLHRAEDREQRYLDDLHLLCNALKKVLLAAGMIVGRAVRLAPRWSARWRIVDASNPSRSRRPTASASRRLRVNALRRSPRPQRSERYAATASLPLERQVSRTK